MNQSEIYVSEPHLAFSLLFFFLFCSRSADGKGLSCYGIHSQREEERKRRGGKGKGDPSLSIYGVPLGQAYYRVGGVAGLEKARICLRHW
jgi:hypothetical protein